MNATNILFMVSVALMLFVWFAPSSRISSRVRWQYGLTAVWVLTLAVLSLIYELKMLG